MKKNNSFYIVANHTGAGKTHFSAALCQYLKAAYFKPVESGHPADSALVHQLAPELKIHPPLRSFKSEMPPHYLAAKAGRPISVAEIAAKTPSGNLVVESAGGWFSPINETETMADLAVVLQFTVIAVLGAYLGGINHSVLMLDAIRNTQVPFAGYVINGDDKFGLQNFLQGRFANIPLLAKRPKNAAWQFMGACQKYKAFNGGYI